MRIWEFHCRKCNAYVEVTDNSLPPKCLNCKSTEIKVTYYEELTVRNLVIRMSELESRVAALEIGGGHESTIKKEH